ncbi:hypothetical protein PsYK624_121980 [Phanerochaete sordida]|uniref:CxC2-like cysteine cluster KDZ transposase-associated domain-containing protein n=1 Tax=Phanerochaete sordida TaxID=48140 RepID=A0A9P3GJ00_9APHY|nr:hypothetical protein PsYK624_121980 [Phanerochaete sordida]
MQSKTSAYDYFKTLKRITDNGFTTDVKDRYREFMAASRQFGFLQTLKWFGKNVNNLKSGCLAVLCAACPNIGINMAPGWEQRPQEKWHLDAMFYAKDGNFTLGQHAKKMDHKDTAFTDGAAYYAPSGEHKRYEEEAADVPECSAETTTCSNFAAGSGKYDGKFKSGQVGLNCARHGVVLPCGTVDLTKDERYSSVDFATAWGLRRWMGLKLLVSSYDINCKYGINWPKRLDWMTGILGWLSGAVWPQIRRCVPKFHLPAHKGICRWINSFYYMPGVGMTDGESPERRWSVLNFIGRSIREMGIGHRLDTLNLHLGDYNIQKNFGIARQLAKKLDTASKKLPEKDAVLKAYEDSLIRDGLPLSEWQAEEAFFIREMASGEARATAAMKKSPYVPREDKAPTRKEILAELAREEMTQQRKRSRCEAKEGADQGLVRGRAAVLKVALDIEENQRDLQTKVKISDARDDDEDLADIEDAREKLRQKLDQWHNSFSCVFGQLVGELKIELKTVDWPERNPNEPEDELLPIPSNLDNALRLHPEMRSVTAAELRFRQGQANDLLSELKNKIGLKAFLWKTTAGQHGQVARTRNGKANKAVESRITEIRNSYNAMRLRLLALGEPNDSHNYRPLTEADCRPMVISHDQEGPGKEKTNLSSWLWRDGAYAEDMNAWQKEGTRIQWFRASAEVARWREEVEHLETELVRVQLFFLHFSRKWDA